MSNRDYQVILLAHKEDVKAQHKKIVDAVEQDGNVDTWLSKSFSIDLEKALSRFREAYVTILGSNAKNNDTKVKLDQLHKARYDPSALMAEEIKRVVQDIIVFGPAAGETEVPGKREAKEQVKAITLRSEKVANPEHSQVSDEEAVVEEERLQKNRIDKQFEKFLEVFKKLYINIPFAEALEQMPSYAKFMKGILSRKVKLDDLKNIALTEECSVVLQQKLPPKLKDP
ncbi:hypothetical protein AgCh_025960 [Apium graveolens]